MTRSRDRPLARLLGAVDEAGDPSQFRTVRLEEQVAEDVAGREQDDLLEALGLFRQGCYDVALRLYARAADRNKRCEAAWVGHVLSLLSLGEPDEALTWAERAIALLPDSGLLPAVKAVALARSGRVSSARKVADEAVRCVPDNALAWWARGDVLAEQDLDAAWDCFDKAQDLSPGDSDLLLWIGKTLLTVNRVGEARDCLEQATELDDEHPMAWYHLGLAERELADFEAARQAFDRALELTPDAIEVERARREIDRTGWFQRRMKRLKTRLHRASPDTPKHRS